MPVKVVQRFAPSFWARLRCLTWSGSNDSIASFFSFGVCVFLIKRHLRTVLLAKFLLGNNFSTSLSSMIPLNISHGRNQSCECYTRYHFNVGSERFQYVGFAGLFIILLALCSLLAGLTLAVSSLDLTWLYILSCTGSEKQRKHAKLLGQIRRRSGWFLCSTIICSVACMESMPIIIQALFGTGWLPIIVSTVTITVLAELIPQFFIPRHALYWGYYSWPVIWGCMWLTCIISWPLSYVLEKISGRHDDRTIYDTEQLSMLVKHHEFTEKHGGYLGRDAGRVARGALDLDGRTLKNRHCSHSHNGKIGREIDVERATVTKPDIIVPWNAVQYLNVKDEVTQDLIEKIKSWSYSRLPVIGETDDADLNDGLFNVGQSQKVYGFLHVKNLVGLDLQGGSQRNKLLVRDLPLYPLPLVRDDLPLYDLLNMFQLGMSRMAIVTPAPIKDRLVPLSVSSTNLDVLPRSQAPLWAATNGLNTRVSVEMRALDLQVDWTTDYLNAIQKGLPIPRHRKQSVIGIECPRPIGIVTYEDIVDTILKKTSRDEKDFFDRNTLDPPTKSRKEGDRISAVGVGSTIRSQRLVPQHENSGLETFTENAGTLRKRKVSTKLADIDGTSNLRVYGFDGVDEHDLDLRKFTVQERSSYTQNSQGGFHDQEDAADIIGNDVLPTAVELASLGATPPEMLLHTMRTVSSPQEIMHSKDFPRGFTTSARHSSDGRMPMIPRLRRVTPFSQENFSNHDNLPQTIEDSLQNGKDIRSTTYTPPFTSPEFPSSLLTQRSRTTYAHPCGNDQILSHYSWLDEAITLNTEEHLGSSPAQSLGQSVTANDQIINENCIPAYASGTLANTEGRTSASSPLGSDQKMEIRTREDSFHDDRALLPSQRRIQNNDSQLFSSRRSSLWF